MSANNEIRIIKKGKKYVIYHWDIEGGKLSDKFTEYDNLEDAVREANNFMEENEVEYGLNIFLD